MNCPDGITQEAWDAATDAWCKFQPSGEAETIATFARAIQSAVEAERERCAEIALNAGSKHYAETHPGHQRVPVELEVFIANKIRRKGP